MNRKQYWALLATVSRNSYPVVAFGLANYLSGLDSRELRKAYRYVLTGRIIPERSLNFEG